MLEWTMAHPYLTFAIVVLILCVIERSFYYMAHVAKSAARTKKESNNERNRT